MSGILYGIGVGANDPEMLTLRAVRLIREADILCLPKIPKEECRAYQIALKAIPEAAEKESICFNFEMSHDRAALERLHGEIYGKLREKLLSGRKLAFLTIGDPTVYSTFCYMAKRAQKDKIKVEYINGINSFCASAAAVGIPLCEGNEEVHILSGQQGLEEKLFLPGAKVIMKSGRKIGNIKKILAEFEKKHPVEIYAVKECGAADEEIFTGAEAIPEAGDYMVTILVKEGKI